VIYQDDPQWVRARIGHLTASRMADAIAVRKDGKPSAARVKLLHDLLAERLVDAAVDHYVTPAMQWGLDNEADARLRYEADSGNLVERGGFVIHPRIPYFGATPDGLIDSDGLLEIKCPTTPTYVAWRTNGVVPEEHRPQLLAQLACTGRQWVDFVAFDPRIKAAPLQVFVRRFEPTAEEIIAIEEAACGFLAELETMFEQLTMKEAA
jgi:putative phage-type endonuclease